MDESTGNFFWDEKANSKTKVKGYVNYGKEFEYFNKKTGLYYYFNNDGPHFVTLPPLTLIYERSRLTIWLDRIQEILDYGGMVEPTPFCDIINGTIYIIRGKWYDGLITLGGIAPYIGDLAKIAKYSKKYSKVADKTGTTVLGHYPEYVKHAESIGARKFQIPPSVWNKMSAAEQWTANTKFLDRMILRGDKIRLATPLNQVKQGIFSKRN